MSKTRPEREKVRHLTYYVVQAYKEVKGRRGAISADEPREARDRDHAMQLFERYRPIRIGVVAFHRTGDPTTGEWEDAVIIARDGRLPPEVDQMEDETAIDPWDIDGGRAVA